jgi:hypothetical protein
MLMAGQKHFEDRMKAMLFNEHTNLLWNPFVYIIHEIKFIDKIYEISKCYFTKNFMICRYHHYVTNTVKRHDRNKMLLWCYVYFCVIEILERLFYLGPI